MSLYAFYKSLTNKVATGGAYAKYNGFLSTTPAPPTPPGPSIPLTAGYNFVTPLVTTSDVTIDVVSGAYYALGNPSGVMNLSTFSMWQGPDFDEFDYSQVLIYTGGDPTNLNDYLTVISDSTSPSLWDDSNFNPLEVAPTLGAGQAFFFNPTVDGSIVFQGPGSMVPGPIIGTALMLLYPDGSITVLPDGVTLTFFTGSNFLTDVVDSSSPSGFSDTMGNPLPEPPSIPIASGFFINLNGHASDVSLLFS
jgi:hypothetical protein